MYQEQLIARTADGQLSEYERRLIFAMMSKNRPAPIPDLTWIIDLVDRAPMRAIEVARSFLVTHFDVMNDLAIDGIFDAIAAIRLRVTSHAEDPVPLQVLRGLDPLDLEALTAALWESLGYDVSLTAVVRDGGRDVAAIATEPGSRLHVLIECKQWAEKVDVSVARQLLGVLASEKAPKGILIAPGGFSSGPGSAYEFAQLNSQLELIDGPVLCEMLAKNFGEGWHLRVDRLVAQGQSKR